MKPRKSVGRSLGKAISSKLLRDTGSAVNTAQVETDWERNQKFQDFILDDDVDNLTVELSKLSGDEKLKVLMYQSDGGYSLFHHAMDKGRLEIAIFLLGQSSKMCTLQTDQGETASDLLQKYEPPADQVALYEQLVSLLVRKEAYVKQNDFAAALQDLDNKEDEIDYSVFGGASSGFGSYIDVTTGADEEEGVADGGEEGPEDQKTKASKPVFRAGALKQGYLTRRKKNKLGELVEEDFFCVLKKNGISFFADAASKDLLAMIPYALIEQIEFKHNFLVLNLSDDKFCDLMSEDLALIKDWHTTLVQNQPQTLPSDIANEKTLIEGMLNGGEYKKPGWYRLKKNYLCFYKKNMDTFVGMRNIAKGDASITKEGDLMLRLGHEPFLLKAVGKDGPKVTDWLDAIKKMQKQMEKEAVEAALRMSMNVASIPPFYEKLIGAISKRGYRTEGIFRISADKDSVDILHQKCLRNEEVDFMAEDIHLLCGVFKKYIRDSMPVPLLTFDLYDEFIAVGNLEKQFKRKVVMVQECFQGMPEGFKRMTFVLLTMLNKIYEFRSDNLMDAKNLSVVFSPSILRSKNETGLSLIQDMEASSNVVAFIIKHLVCCQLKSEEPCWNHPDDFDDDEDNAQDSSLTKEEREEQSRAKRNVFGTVRQKKRLSVDNINIKLGMKKGAGNSSSSGNGSVGSSGAASPEVKKKVFKALPQLPTAKVEEPAQEWEWEVEEDDLMEEEAEEQAEHDFANEEEAWEGEEEEGMEEGMEEAGDGDY